MRRVSAAIHTAPSCAMPKRMGLAILAIVLAVGCGPKTMRSAEGDAKRGATQSKPQAGPDRELTLDLGNGVKLELVLVPAGKFMMGSPEKEAKRDSDETRHEVTIRQPFYMGKYLVTQEQFEKVMGANHSKFKGAKNPVNNVAWDDAQDFCRKLSTTSGKTAQLPTEAQWEYACRAGSTTVYCFGDSDDLLADYAWYGDNSKSTAHAVGEKKPNAWGLYDMHGSLLEWCQDWYSENYYSESPKVDPQGPAKGGSRVLRGGCWYVSTWDCRSAYRYWGWPGNREGYNGFRVVVPVAAKTPP